MCRNNTTFNLVFQLGELMHLHIVYKYFKNYGFLKCEKHQHHLFASNLLLSWEFASAISICFLFSVRKLCIAIILFHMLSQYYGGSKGYISVQDKFYCQSFVGIFALLINTKLLFFIMLNTLDLAHHLSRSIPLSSHDYLKVRYGNRPKNKSAKLSNTCLLCNLFII